MSWQREKQRHYLASQGVLTKQRSTESKPVMKLVSGVTYKSTNPESYRYDELFEIVGVTYLENLKRYAYIKRFWDGEIDMIPVHNNGGYEIVKDEPEE
jgi:hypothetical protein